MWNGSDGDPNRGKFENSDPIIIYLYPLHCFQSQFAQLSFKLSKTFYYFFGSYNRHLFNFYYQVPDRPRDVALNQVKLKFIDRERFAVVEAMFLQAVLRIPSKKIDLFKLY